MINKTLKITKAISLFILFLTFSYIPAAIFNINLDNLSYNQKIIYSFSCDLLFLIIIITAYHKTLIRDFKLFFKDFFKNFETAFKYWFAGFLIMVISNIVIMFVMGGEIAQNEEMVRTMIKQATLYMIFSISIYAPLTEELIFRKSIRDIISSKWIYILASGLIFGGLHILSSLESAIDLIYLIPYSSLGIAFAMCYYKTNNIFSTISMHCMHNTMALIIYLMAGTTL